MQFSIEIQTKDFSVEDEIEQMLEINKHIGAVVNFVGYVRKDHPEMIALELEHYPQMSEKQIARHVNLAQERWPLISTRIVHRVGRLAIGEQIVMIAVASEHRKPAFEAAEFLMDFLKTEAPFWKKQINQNNEYWVEAKDKDNLEKEKWNC